MMNIYIIKDLIKYAQKAENEGLCKHKSGNFSILDRATGLVYITPSGFYRSDLTVDDIVISDLNGNVRDNINFRKPSIELAMHLKVYLKRPDVNAIVHTHSPYATAFAVKGIKIEPITSEAYFYGKNMEIVPYFEHGTEELAEGVANAIKYVDVCLLKNHGILTVSDAIENAYLKAVYVESVAMIDYISRTL
jgi:L-fuculose-phosphate aldolase